MENNKQDVQDIKEVQDIKDVQDTKGDNTDKVDLFEVLEDKGLSDQFASEVDRRITKALQTREKKHQEELARQKRLANMTADEIQQEKERELEERERQLQQYELRIKKVDYLKENNLPLELEELLVVENEDDIVNKANTAMNIINNIVEQKVKESLKSNGYELPKNVDKDKSLTSIDDLAGYTPEEINAFFDKLV